MSISALHDSAMELADKADRIRRRDRTSAEARQLFLAAYELEQQAVDELLAGRETDMEPSRSILLRSAAALAARAGLAGRAKKLLHLALSGCPPYPLDEEIQEDLQALDAEEHLALNGVSLTAEEVQISLAEADIGPGWADSDDVTRRLEAIKQMYVRTSERKNGRPFRVAGRPDSKAIQPRTFVSMARSQSYAFTVRFGTMAQELDLHEAERPLPIAAAVTEVMECLAALEAQGEAGLAERIPDESYLRNFAHYARELRPDGKHVGLVGVTCVADGRERKVQLRPVPGKGQSTPPPTTPESSPPGPSATKQPGALRGSLAVADTSTNSVWIHPADGSPRVKLKVQTGLVEIVRKHFGDLVEVTLQAGPRRQQIMVDIVAVDELD